MKKPLATLLTLILSGSAPLNSWSQMQASSRAAGRASFPGSVGVIGVSARTMPETAVPLALQSLSLTTPSGAPHLTRTAAALLTLQSAALDAKTPASAAKPSASGNQAVNGASATGAPNPHSANFEERAWQEAQRLGFVRRPQAVEGQDAAQNSNPLAKSAPDASAAVLNNVPGPESDVPVKSPKIFSKTVMSFLLNFFIVQVALESTALGMSQMTKPLKNGFLSLGLLMAFSQLAALAGSLLVGQTVDKRGVRTSYRTVLFTRFLIWSNVARIYAEADGHPSIPAMIALFSMDYFFHAISRTAEGKLQMAWFKGDTDKSARFATIRDFLDYGISFMMTAVTGVAIATCGMQVMIYSVPAVFLVAWILSMTVGSGMPQASPKKTKKIALLEGVKFNLSTRAILIPLLGAGAMNAFVYMIYLFLGTTFGQAISGAKDAAAAISGSVTSFYGLGAMAAGLVMWKVTNAMEKSGRARELATRYASLALKWAAGGMLAGWFFMNTTKLGTVAGLPIYVLMPAIAVMGLTSQAAFTLLDTIWKDRIPEDKAAEMGGSISGAGRAIYSAMVIVSALLWAFVFQNFAAAAFALVGLYCTLAGVYYLRLSRDIRKE
jgi:hypothetical protein